MTLTKKERRHNITYTQAGVSCFVGQVSGIFEVQFFVGSSVLADSFRFQKPTNAKPETVMPHSMTTSRHKLF